jgi:hypothetical protein
MEDSLRLINDAQREALAEIVVRRYDRRIEVAQEGMIEISAQIEKALAKPFDCEKLEAEIKRFRTLVDNLEARKRELTLVQTLTAERDTTEQGVWLAATVEEAQRLVARVEAPQEAAK